MDMVFTCSIVDRFMMDFLRMALKMVKEYITTTEVTPTMMDLGKTMKSRVMGYSIAWRNIMKGNGKVE